MTQTNQPPGNPARFKDPARGRFIGFGSSSLDLEIFAYVMAADYAESLEVQENLNLRIMEIFAAGGARFAFPSNTVYLRRDGKADREKDRDTTAKVQAGNVPLPRFGRHRVDQLAGTVPFAPDMRPSGNSSRIVRAN